MGRAGSVYISGGRYGLDPIKRRKKSSPESMINAYVLFFRPNTEGVSLSLSLSFFTSKF